jgi:hypothetical protein
MKSTKANAQPIHTKGEENEYLNLHVWYISGPYMSAFGEGMALACSGNILELIQASTCFTERVTGSSQVFSLQK